MSTSKLSIKNMVCNRCIEAVLDEFSKHEIPVADIKLGEVSLKSIISPEGISKLRRSLEKRGFELLEDKNIQLLEQIKTLIIDKVHHNINAMKVNYSTYLEREIGKEYSQLSSLFSSVEGITIERFIILQKLEKVKELLIYDELNLSEIAHKLDYSSVQHLSNQFKKNIGMSPSEFRKLKEPLRKPIDSV